MVYNPAAVQLHASVHGPLSHHNSYRVCLALTSVEVAGQGAAKKGAAGVQAFHGALDANSGSSSMDEAAGAGQTNGAKAAAAALAGEGLAGQERGPVLAKGVS